MTPDISWKLRKETTITTTTTKCLVQKSWCFLKEAEKSLAERDPCGYKLECEDREPGQESKGSPQEQTALCETTF